MRALYLHFPRFPIQRRVAEMPSLAGKPIVLSEEKRNQRKVAFASTAALTAGIRAGMTVTAATALIPSLEEFPYRLEEERNALLSLGEALLSIAPAFQLSAPDGLWLDASAAALCRGEEGFCRRALEGCASLGYRAKAALASQLFTARAVARDGAVQVKVVGSAESASALAPLPLGNLDFGSSQLDVLRSWGLSTLGEVAALPPGAVVARMGLEGLRIHRLSRGEDDALLVPTAPAEVFEEHLALDWPAESLEPLLFALKTILDRLCARLAGRNRAAVRLSVVLRLSHGEQQRVELVLSQPSTRAKLLLELAKNRISDLALSAPIAELRIRVEESCEDRGHQRVLGDMPEQHDALDVVLSRLSSALGAESLFAAEVDCVHRPERAYHPKPFRPPTSERGILKGTAEDKASQGPAESLERPARFFARPAPLKMEWSGQGNAVCVRLLGQRRKALEVTGPERLCGDWWEEVAYSRDYYRVHFEGLGPAWIYRDERDGQFYLQGLFD